MEEELKRKNYQYGQLSNKYAELKEKYRLAIGEINLLRTKLGLKEDGLISPSSQES